MANKVLNTRIKQKIDLLTAWEASTLVLLQGEFAIAVDNMETPTEVKIKVGNGKDVFKDLPWASMTKGDVDALIQAEYANKFVFMCGGAADDFEVPEYLTDEVREAIKEDAYADILKMKF